MACMITLHLRALGPEIEKPTHPSHKSWQKSLKLLRDFVKIKPTSKHAIRWEQSYYCADKERPDEVIYFYPYLSESTFKAVEASCATETSRLSIVLSPLLKEPLSSASITRLRSDLKSFPDRTKCLEFLTVHYDEIPSDPVRLFSLSFLLEQAYVPLVTFWYSFVDGSKNILWCIHWLSFQERVTFFEHSNTRHWLRHALTGYARNWDAVVQSLGKMDEDLTWEDRVRIYFLCEGATDVQSRLVSASLVTDDFLGIRDRKKNRPCVIL